MSRALYERRKRLGRCVRCGQRAERGVLCLGDWAKQAAALARYRAKVAAGKRVAELRRRQERRVMIPETCGKCAGRMRWEDEESAACLNCGRRVWATPREA